MSGSTPEPGALLATLSAPPEGHAAAVLSVCGCTPREALTGPMPPGFGVMALIAEPMLSHDGDVHQLAMAMAADANEWEWREALLPFFPEVTDE